MAKFIKCSVPIIKYSNGKTLENNIVNVDMCTKLKIGEYYSYPDKNGSFYILFHGLDHQWIYRNKEDRDIDFETIMKG